MTVWQLAGAFVAAALLLAAYIDVAERRRHTVHRRRMSHAFWMEVDERSTGMRAGEHGLWGMYVPEVVPHRPGASKQNAAQ